MRKIYHLIFLLFLISIFTYHTEIHARPKPRTVVQPTWAAEPNVFIGITFGQPFDTQMSECPKQTYSDGISMYEHDYSSDAKTCWENLSHRFRTINHPPVLGVYYEATALVVNGLFAGMVMTFQHHDYLKMLELFQEKYGSPTQTQKSFFQTRGGMKLEGNIHHWVGRNVEIRLSEYGGKIDEGEVNISTKALLDNYIEENKKNSGLYKDNL